MSDNLAYATGNVAGLPDGTVLATEDISSAHHQRVKVVLGAKDADNGDLDGSNVLTLLASNPHTTAQTSDPQSTPNARGLLLFLDVTHEAGSGKTLSVKIEALDPVSGNYALAYDFSVLVTHATGTFSALVYPGITTGDFGGTVAKNGAVPRDWHAIVTPSDSTSWTYSLGAAVLH